MVELSGGSDGDCTVNYDFSSLNLRERQEILDPILFSPRKKSQGRYSMPLTHIPEEQWEEVAQRHVNGESLRLLAKSYGVSYEAVRQVVKR
jgi:hypothetical protein